jgi:hypothetical protein
MVKAKELKLMRKALDQYNKSTVDPLEKLMVWNNEYWYLQLQLHDTGTCNGSLNPPPETLFRIRTVPVPVPVPVARPSTSSETSTETSVAAVADVSTTKDDTGIIPITTSDTDTTVNSTNTSTGNTKDLIFETKEKLSINTQIEESVESEEPQSQLPVSVKVKPQFPFIVRYYRTLSKNIFEQCIQLFTTNMKQRYEQSSWGYNDDEKRNEFTHPNARFITISLDNNKTKDDGDDRKEVLEEETVVAFVHYRYCYDDDDQPSSLVLYVYEMQVHTQYQKLGIGRYCMSIIEAIGKLGIDATTSPLVTETKENKVNVPMKKKTANSKIKFTSKVTAPSLDQSSLPNTIIQKVMLTVFRTNQLAMNFYLDKLQYTIDSSSPSKYNQITDYEILSKMIL